MEEVLKRKEWMHFFPEGFMWFYYPDIRPIKKAVFKYAVDFDRPILPITLSFRPGTGLWKLNGKEIFMYFRFFSRTLLHMPRDSVKINLN